MWGLVNVLLGALSIWGLGHGDARSTVGLLAFFVLVARYAPNRTMWKAARALNIDDVERLCDRAEREHRALVERAAKWRRRKEDIEG